MTLNFSGKVAIVTGAGSGIGRATAEALATAGASVVVADVSRKGGEETVARIAAAKGNGSFIACDVSNPAQVKAMIEHALASYGRLDVAVNNAGIDPEFAPEAAWKLEDFDNIMAVNLRGVFLCMQQELAPMLAQGGGAIVNVASFAALNGVANKPAYVASKHGVLGLTRAAALQYAKRGIRINAVCPGGVRTPIMYDNLPGRSDMTGINAAHPIGRVAEPQEIAAAILWLASPEAAFVIGHGLAIDGGLAVQ